MPLGLKVTLQQTLAVEVTEGHYLPHHLLMQPDYGMWPVVLCESGAEQLNTKATIIRIRDGTIFAME